MEINLNQLFCFVSDLAGCFNYPCSFYVRFFFLNLAKILMIAILIYLENSLTKSQLLKTSHVIHRHSHSISVTLAHFNLRHREIT